MLDDSLHLLGDMHTCDKWPQHKVPPGESAWRGEVADDDHHHNNDFMKFFWKIPDGKVRDTSEKK